MNETAKYEANNQPMTLSRDFASVLQIIEQNRLQAVQMINHASVLTAWQVGAFVSDRIKNAAWGSKVVQQLAEYIHTQNPTLKGWSKVTIYRMVQFYETYSSAEFINLLVHLKLQKQIVPLEAAQMASKEIVSYGMTQLPNEQIVSFEMTQIPSVLFRTGWTNHQIILRQCSLPEQYVFYILYAEYQKLQNKQLEREIRTDAYSRVLSDKKLQSAMLKETYPQADVLLKDRAILEFLGLPQRYKESKLRKEIVSHMKDFILEMGKDFLFVDQEHTLEVGGQNFRCDLLFYHRALQCLVAIELKTTTFDPRDLGQLEFYLEALDQTEKRSNENPSIGILMCKDANPEVVRYALNRSVSPTMVSKYEEQLKVGSVLQRSLEEFVGFISEK
jgi:predicted nuclease of restriction endonuclease-like (RecB) superfamily